MTDTPEGSPWLPSPVWNRFLNQISSHLYIGRPVSSFTTQQHRIHTSNVVEFLSWLTEQDIEIPHNFLNAYIPWGGFKIILDMLRSRENFRVGMWSGLVSRLLPERRYTREPAIQPIIPLAFRVILRSMFFPNFPRFPLFQIKPSCTLNFTFKAYIFFFSWLSPARMLVTNLEQGPGAVHCQQQSYSETNRLSKEILEQHHEFLRTERNAFGYTAIHLAIGWRDGLELLLWSCQRRSSTW